MKMKKTAAFFAAAVMAVSLMSGCGSEKSKSDSSTDKKQAEKTKTESASEKSEDENTDPKVEVYLAEDGTPYYIDENGQKWMLFSTQMNDDGTEDLGGFTYDHYDKDGLSFDIPEGWFCDDSYGYGLMFRDSGSDIIENYDESIAVLPTSIVFPELEGDIDEEYFTAYYDELVAEDFYTAYELTDSGKTTVAGMDALYFNLTVTYTEPYAGEGEADDQESETFRSRYVVTLGDNSHSIVISSYDTDESFKSVTDAFDSVSDTIKLPTAEQMAEMPEAVG